MAEKTVEERFSPNGIAPNELKEITADFLKLDWVQNMGMYVRTIKTLGLPPEPPNQEGMKTANAVGERILSVPELMERARGNADKWEPMLGKMGNIAGGIQIYAETSVTAIEFLLEEHGKYSTLTNQNKELFKRDFLKGLDQLKKLAAQHKITAATMQNEVIAYSHSIEKDHDMSKDIQDKYAKWLEDEKKQVEAWEKSHNVPHDQTGEALMKKFEEMVAEYHTKWAGLASGAGAATMGMVILPPFGTIASFFAMSLWPLRRKRCANSWRSSKTFWTRCSGTTPLSCSSTLSTASSRKCGRRAPRPSRLWASSRDCGTLSRNGWKIWAAK